MTQKPIAIVGIGCRFPGGANTPLKFWQLLQTGGDAIQEIPPDRWNQQTFYHIDPVEPGKTYARWGGFIEDMDKFDAKFFGINRQEAARLDPQHRHLLEVTWEALEDAGIPPDRLAGSNTGVFVGMSFHDYPDLQFSPSECETLNAYSIMGAGSGASSRLAYWFDLHGPSMCVDTACSSSLVATHLACQSIWYGESDMALAAGVNLILKPEMTVAMSKAFLLSTEGRCKSFDASADGYVRGEGTGVVVLKPLAQAIKDNDNIYAVIHATVVNQDGRKSSLAAPSGVAQELALQKAYQQAKIEPQQIQYVEAQGTGTQVGDPIEANAIGAVVGGNRKMGQDCFIGSVKTNIGHLEGAAGIASLIKTALMLHYGQVPPNLHFKTPNPKIPFESLHLQVPTRLEKWRAGRRLAGVNSFGVGGTNAHVVLENVKPVTKKEQRSDDSHLQLLPLSAKTAPALRQLVQAWLDYLADEGANNTISLVDMCYTASVRRAHHVEQRITFLVHTKVELVDQLNHFLTEPPTINVNDNIADALTVAQDMTLIQAAKQGQELARAQFLTALSEIYQHGQSVDWSQLYPEGGRLVRLPGYAWQRQRYWHESEASREQRIGQPDSHSTHANSLDFERDNQQEVVQPKYEFLERLKATPVYERRELLTQHVCTQVAEVMGLDTPESLNLEQGFFDMGMASLQAISLHNNLKLSLGCSLSVTSAFKYPTIRALVDYLIEVALPIDFAQLTKSSDFKLGTNGYGTTNISLAMTQDLDKLLHQTDDEATLLALLLKSLNETPLVLNKI